MAWSCNGWKTVHALAEGTGAQRIVKWKPVVFVALISRPSVMISALRLFWEKRGGATNMWGCFAALGRAGMSCETAWRLHDAQGKQGSGEVGRNSSFRNVLCFNQNISTTSMNSNIGTHISLNSAGLWLSHNAKWAFCSPYHHHHSLQIYWKIWQCLFNDCAGIL